MPNHFFYTKIQKTSYLNKIAKELIKKNKEETLKSVYDFVTNNFTRKKYKFILFSYKLFKHDVENLLEKKQFAQCTLQNLTFVTLLINTKQFKSEDIKRKWKIVNFIVPHQYVIVRIGKSSYKVDLLLKIFKTL